MLWTSKGLQNLTSSVILSNSSHEWNSYLVCPIPLEHNTTWPCLGEKSLLKCEVSSRKLRERSDMVKVLLLLIPVNFRSCLTVKSKLVEDISRTTDLRLNEFSFSFRYFLSMSKFSHPFSASIVERVRNLL